MTASNHSHIAVPMVSATRPLRGHAKCEVVTALVITASSVFGAGQVLVTMWPRSEWAHPVAAEPVPGVTARPPVRWESGVDDTSLAGRYGQARSDPNTHAAGLAALIRPVPLGEIAPQPPDIPAPVIKAIPPPSAPPAPRAQRPLPPPEAPPAQSPPPEMAPPPPLEQPLPEAPPALPAPPELAPPLQQPGPAPQEGAPPPQEEPPNPPRRGYIRLSP
jgi:hypothetical protein